MSTRLPTLGSPLLLLLLTVTAACERAELNVTAPASAAAGPDQPSNFAVEPLTLRPEFLPGGSCHGRPAFGARIRIVIGGGHDLILRRLKFGFNDRFGSTVFPDVIPIPTLSAPTIPAQSIPTSTPIPLPGIAALPGASSIALPGTSPTHGLFIPAGTSRGLPFFLRFGCGVLADGILLVSAETGDRSGRFATSTIRVRIGS